MCSSVVAVRVRIEIGIGCSVAAIRVRGGIGVRSSVAAVQFRNGIGLRISLATFGFMRSMRDGRTQAEPIAKQEMNPGCKYAGQIPMIGAPAIRTATGKPRKHRPLIPRKSLSHAFLPGCASPLLAQLLRLFYACEQGPHRNPGCTPQIGCQQVHLVESALLQPPGMKRDSGDAGKTGRSVKAKGRDCQKRSVIASQALISAVFEQAEQTFAVLLVPEQAAIFLQGLVHFPDTVAAAALAAVRLRSHVPPALSAKLLPDERQRFNTACAGREVVQQAIDRRIADGTG
ncbi:hypothetical protein D478_08748 [Brevibacillus agri BAB-2500]|nr:hypothetical protein D478_08748 [Brevibacillus agri BAB-2500]